MRIAETINFKFHKNRVVKKDRKKNKGIELITNVIKFFASEESKSYPKKTPSSEGVEDAVIVGEEMQSAPPETAVLDDITESELLEALFETAFTAKEAFECGWDNRWNPTTLEGFFTGIAAPKLKSGRLYKILGPSPEEKRALAFSVEGKSCVVIEALPPGIGGDFELTMIPDGTQVTVQLLKELLLKNCNMDYAEV